MYNELLFEAERQRFQRECKKIATQYTLRIKDVITPKKSVLTMPIQGESKDGNIQVGRNDKFRALAMRVSFQREAKVGEKWLPISAKYSYDYAFPGEKDGISTSNGIRAFYDGGFIAIVNATGVRLPKTTLSGYRFKPEEHLASTSRGFVPMYTPGTFVGGNSDKIEITPFEDFREAFVGFDDKGIESINYRLVVVAEVFGFNSPDELA
ncbi:MAG: hypothetical protein RLZZ628_2882 [Bacteroidota bacterium]|jgi:hypothetical protein